MSSLQGEFRLFTALFPTAEEEASEQRHLANDLLSGFPDDSGFWLSYAEICRAHDDHSEAFTALDRGDELIEVERASIGSNPLLALILDSLKWRLGRCRADLLKVVARGNPSTQSALIENLQNLAQLSYERICSNFEIALAQVDDPALLHGGLETKWVRHLVSLRLAIQQRGFHEASYKSDLSVLQDLAIALMGAGRFTEAAQVFTESSYSSFVPIDEESEREIRWHPLLVSWLAKFLQNPLRHTAPFVNTGRRYVIALVVWGDDFLDSLEQFSLPSLLASGNLPYLREEGEVHLLLFTTDSGAARLEQMPCFQTVRNLITVDLVVFPSELAVFRDSSTSYKLMSTMHLAGMKAAKANRAHFFFIAPDIVLANNFLQVVDQKMRGGAEVVFVPGLMLQMETFHADQIRRYPATNSVLSISPQDLLQLGLRHVHPTVINSYTYAPVKRRASASVFLWPLANDGGYLVHAFHHTPYLVSAGTLERFDDSFFFTIDGEFLLKILRNQEELERCALLTDMQETNYFELSRGSRYDFPVDYDMPRYTRFGKNQGMVAKWLFQQKVHFASVKMTQDDPIHFFSTKVVEEIIEGMDRLHDSWE